MLTRTYSSRKARPQSFQVGQESLPLCKQCSTRADLMDAAKKQHAPEEFHQKPARAYSN